MSNKKVIVIIGAILIILGVFSIGYDQISYAREEKVLDVGPFQATVEDETQCVRTPVILGVIITIAGIWLIIAASKKRRKR